MVEACHSLHRGLQGEVDLAKLFAYDAVYEDMALRALFVGRSAIERYVRRSKPPCTVCRRINGSSYRWKHFGRWYEWSASPEHGPRAA